MKICLTCEREFTSQRSSAKYCSDKCRVEMSRREAQALKEEMERRDRKVKPDNTPYDTAKNLAAFQKMGMVKVDWLTTGIPEFDELTMIPRGRVTQIQGPYAVGKTTLALNMIKGLRHHKVFYIDSEAALNPELLVKLEIPAKNFTLYNESAFIEDIYQEIINAAKSDKYDLIILDSLAATTFRTESEGLATDRNIGQKALIVNKLMRILPMELKNTNTALVIINQEREVIGSYAPIKYTPGGMGVPYAASLIVGLKTIPSWRFPKDAKDGLFEGHEVEAKILKSRVNQPSRVKKFKLYYPEPAPPPIFVDAEGETVIEPTF